MTTTGHIIASPQKLRTAVTVFFFISGFGYSSWASRIPSIQQQLHLNEAQLGSLLFAMPVGLMLTMPFTSNLLGKYSSKKIMLIGVLAFSVVLSLPGFAANTWQLAAILFCFGSSRNMMNLSVNAQAVEVQQHYSKSIMTTLHGVWSIAGFAGAGLGYLMVKYNVGVAYHLCAVSLSVLILTIIFYKDTPRHDPDVLQHKRKVYVLPDKHLVGFAIICFCCMACENTMYDWSAIYFQNAVHATKSEASAAFVIYMICMTTGRFAGDKLVAKTGIKLLLKCSGWLILAGLGTAVLLPYPITAGIGFGLVGFGVSCIVPLVFSMAGKSVSMHTAQALASVSTIGYLGFLLVPPMVGYIAHAFNLQWSFAVIALLGGVIVYTVSKIKEQ